MNCDAIAPYYAAMEYAAFGHTLERCRFHFLPKLATSRRALVLGDGDGRFLARLLAAAPNLQTDYVDCSRGMFAKAQRIAGSERATYHCLDVLRDPLPSADYDLIATHFLLDCFSADEQLQLANRLSQAAPNARWLVSEFRVPDKRWLAAPARACIGVMYRFFLLTTGLKTQTLSDHHPALKAAGYERAASQSFGAGFIVSELWTPEVCVTL